MGVALVWACLALLFVTLTLERARLAAPGVESIVVGVRVLAFISISLGPSLVLGVWNRRGANLLMMLLAAAQVGVAYLGVQRAEEERGSAEIAEIVSLDEEARLEILRSELALEASAAVAALESTRLEAERRATFAPGNSRGLWAGYAEFVDSWTRIESAYRVERAALEAVPWFDVPSTTDEEEPARLLEYVRRFEASADALESFHRRASANLTAALSKHGVDQEAAERLAFALFASKAQSSLIEHGEEVRRHDRMIAARLRKNFGLLEQHWGRWLVVPNGHRFNDEAAGAEFAANVKRIVELMQEKRRLLAARLKSPGPANPPRSPSR